VAIYAMPRHTAPHHTIIHKERGLFTISPKWHFAGEVKPVFTLAKI